MGSGNTACRRFYQAKECGATKQIASYVASLTASREIENLK